MDTPPLREPTQAREHALNQPNRPLFTLPVDALEQRIQPLYTRMIATIHELEETVDAISSYAVVAHYHEHQYHTLADAAREAMALLQAVTSQQHIPPEWMARRDVLAARLRATLNNHQQLATTTANPVTTANATAAKGGTTPP